MKRRRISIWTRAAALGPLLALVLSSPVQALVRCSMDGQIRAACCCPTRAAASAEASAPTLRAAPCCARETVPDGAPGVEATRVSPHDLPPVLAMASAPFVFSAETLPRRAAPELRGAAREGPRIVLSKHAFLI